MDEDVQSAYADMLHDTERNQKYDVALTAAIKLIHSRGMKARVLDIGTGTGLLSMMAARSGADTVTACEAFTPMAGCARRIMEQNGFADKINLIPKRSNEVTVGPDGDMPERANILVTEVFDTELIGEGAIPTFHHAHQQLLTKDCIVVPTAANMYIQVVHCDKARDWSRFLPITLPDGEKIVPPTELRRCSGTISVHDVQMEQIPPDWFTPITPPIKIFSFDYSGKSTIEFKGHDLREVNALASGRCDAVFMWWDLQMDTAGDVMLSCAPGWAHPTPNQLQWRDHWMQAVYYPQKQLEVESGETFTLHSCHDDYSLWFDVARSNHVSKPRPPDPPACRCGGHVTCSWTRLGMMNDTERTKIYIQALEQVITKETVCLSISDGSLLPLIAAKLGAKKVYSLEPQPMCRKMIDHYLEENHMRHRVTVLNKSAEEVLPEDFNDQKIDLIISEPYFYTTTLPWHNLLFWYSRTELHDLMVENPTVLPWVASIKAIAVDFDDLWKIRAPVGHCEGLDLTHFDKLIEKACDSTDAYLEPHPLWEYPGKPISNVFDILHLDFSRQLSSIKVVEREGFIELWTSGTCNGVAVWMDYHLDRSNTVTMGLVQPPAIGDKLQWDTHTRQAVHLFKNPVTVANGQSQNWRLKHKVIFRPKTGELDFKFEIIENKQSVKS